jgi:dolichol-phosphate mannosyltransferase
MEKKIEITLIIPVYEEEDSIVELFYEIHETVPLPHKAIIIFDHHEDSTLSKKDELISRYPNVRFIKNVYGKGIINAFKTGFEAADTKYVVPIMADLSDMPETINQLYAKIQEGYDLVVASRYVEGGAKVGGPVIKYLLSRAANLSLNKLTDIPIHDMTNAFIIYKKTVIDSIDIESTGGFEITMEIIAKCYRQGFRMTEIPTINRDRKSGSSKFNLMSWIFKYFYWYQYILRQSIVRRLMRFYWKKP